MASRKVKPERESRVVKPTIDLEELFMATLSETWQWQAFTKLTHNWSFTQLRGLEPWYHKPRMYVGILSVCSYSPSAARGAPGENTAFVSAQVCLINAVKRALNSFIPIS